MTNTPDEQSSKFPDDFRPDSLLPPSGLIKDTFERLAEKLFQGGTIEHTKAVEVDFHESESDKKLRILCSHKGSSWAPGEPTKIRDSITIGTDIGTRWVSTDFVTDPEDKQVIEHALKTVASGLSYKDEAWLLTAYDLTQNKTAEGEYPKGSIEALIESSPFEYLESTEYWVSHRFKNGDHVSSHSFEGNEMFTTDWSANDPTQVIDLVTADETRYGYAKYKDGRESLLIERPDLKPKREVIPKNIIETTSIPGLTVSMTGSPEIMRAITEAMEARREAIRLGLDKLTEGNLREFTTALQAAMDSGIVPPKD